MTPTPHIPGAEIADVYGWLCRHHRQPDIFAYSRDERDRAMQRGYTITPLWDAPTANVPPQVNEAVTVKPLEWRNPYIDHQGYVAHSARGLVGNYSVFTLKADSLWVAELDNKTLGEYGSEAEAKAAAQADYETRVRSAIRPLGDGIQATTSYEWTPELYAAFQLWGVEVAVNDSFDKLRAMHKALDRALIVPQEAVKE